MRNDLTHEQLKQEVTVALPLGVLLRLNEQPALQATTAIAAGLGSLKDLPAIGEKFGGGIYAGLTIHENAPMVLVLLPEKFKGQWDAAMKWAKEQEGELPSRIDQLVLFKNLKGEFEEAYYWSSEQLAGYGAYAWGQDFGYGSQCFGLKSTEGQARAVRRIPIQ